MTYTFVDNPTVSGVSVCDTDILNDDIMWLKENLDNRYVVAKSDKSIMPSWWVEYNDGWCVQGGTITAGNDTKIYFLVDFKDTNYQGQITEQRSGPYGSGQQNVGFYPAATDYAQVNSGVSVGQSCQWIAYGYTS